jgi:hypothetical protein
MKVLAIIWALVVVVAGFNVGYVSAYIDHKTGQTIQRTERGVKLQPTVSGEYLQNGFSKPFQHTIDGKELQGSEPVLQGN